MTIWLFKLFHLSKGKITMSDNKLLQQEEIDALLNGSGTQQEEPEVNNDSGLTQDAIDQMLQAAQGDEQQSDNKELDQNDIDALIMAAQNDRQELLEPEDNSPDDEQPAAQDEQGNKGTQVNDSKDPIDLSTDLTMEEKDALGEIGNISMGSSATTLSQLLNRRVQITSPKVIVTNQDDFFNQFNVPYLVIKVKFTEGFDCYNVLIIKMHDAIMMANLMMGGDGTDLPEEISEMEISAASEAMNQMIGTASTALADLLERKFYILPPETDMVQEIEKMNVTLPFGDPIVVISFRMKIEDLLDTSIMQVLDIETAREQATLLWKKFGVADDVRPAEHEKALDTTSKQAPDLDTSASTDEQILHEANEESFKTNTSSEEPVQTQDIEKNVLSGVALDKLNLLLDIPLKVSVVLGRAQKQIKEVLQMTPGAIVELETLVDEPVDILVNGKLIAKGEIVVVNENFGIKINSIVSTRARINTLKG